jgi:rhamnosyl/mannosyltransferase
MGGIVAEVFSLTANKVIRTIEINGYLVHRFRLDFRIASTVFSVSACWRFWQLVKQANIIHYHFPWPFMDMVYFVNIKS